MLFSKMVASLSGTLRLSLACCALACGLDAQATALTVLMADDHPPHADFVRLLRESQPPASRFDVVRVDASGGIQTAAADASPATAASTAASVGPAADDEHGANVGVRTRSLRPAPPSSTAATLPLDNLTVAVGVRAARSAIERPGTEPLLLALVSRLEYEDLRAMPALRRPDRRVGVLLRDPAMTDQLAVMAATLPESKHRLGLVVTAESEPLLRELQRAAGNGWEMHVEYAPDARSLAAALRNVLPRSDALVVLPDQIGDNQAATLAVLRAGASAGLPVFGASEGMVRSGGLAAAVSTPAQLAQQARSIGIKLMSSSGPQAGGPWVEAATPASVRVNATVARSLGLRVPNEHELAERVAAAR